MKEGKFLLRDELKIHQIKRKYYVHYEWEDFLLQKLDEPQIEYIDYYGRIYYIVMEGRYVSVIKWWPDFNLHKVYKLVYWKFDMQKFRKMFIENYTQYFEDNIIFVTPFDKSVDLRTFWVYINVTILNELEVIVEARIMDFEIPRWTSLDDLSCLISWFFMWTRIQKEIWVKESVRLSVHQKYMNTYITSVWLRLHKSFNLFNFF